MGEFGLAGLAQAARGRDQQVVFQHRKSAGDGFNWLPALCRFVSAPGQAAGEVKRPGRQVNSAAAGDMHIQVGEVIAHPGSQRPAGLIFIDSEGDHAARGDELGCLFLAHDVGRIAVRAG